MGNRSLLLNKITEKKAIIGIIGLGYVGLPLALIFAEKGFTVIGLDNDDKKIPKLMNGNSYIRHIPSGRISDAINTKKLLASSDFSLLSGCDCIIICVPTPLDSHRQPDISFIKKSGQIIAKYLRKGQLVSLESSTYPGTTEEILLPLFEKNTSGKEEPNGNGTSAKAAKLKVGEDFFLAFSPEREDPNNSKYNTANTPKVVGGVTPACLEIACKLYDQIVIKTVPVTSTRAAESAKLLENIYRSVNIALVNELKIVFSKMGIDIWEVIEAAKTKPFGFQAFYPGPGLGGHCIPIDPFYLTWKAHEFDISTKFIELAGEINSYQPYYVVQKTLEALNFQNKPIRGSKVLILGVAYKKNIDDLRESQSLKLIELFLEKGAAVDYSDPFVPSLPSTRKYKYNMSSVDLTAGNILKYDLLLLSTDHDDFDYTMIADTVIASKGLIIDTRNAFERNGIKSGYIIKA
jgi:UDP-N-acetyl-D-glucosamine dehydrogenase